MGFAMLALQAVLLLVLDVSGGVVVNGTMSHQFRVLAVMLYNFLRHLIERLDDGLEVI